ncbi:cell division protein PerM [Nocardiopsis gilva]
MPGPRDPRPVYTAGGMAAAWAAGVGLVVLLTITVIGWAAAPHGPFGQDIDHVLRTAVQMWLVGHLVGFGIPGGEIGMLPLGLVVLPGLVLYRSGRWLARSCELPRLRHLFRAALAIAGPYAAISGTLALIGQTEVVQPSVVEALFAGFALALVAGGMGVLHQLLNDKGIPKRRLLEVVPDRPRSLLAGTLGATGTLLLSGALLVGIAFALDYGEAAAITGQLAPGLVGGALLILLQLLYLPNAIVFGTAYAVGPGFALGTGTMVAPTGIAVGPLPLFPLLAALPDNGPAPVISLVALAAPFVAGGVGGVLTQRSAPTLVGEAAPMWGFVCGVGTGAVLAVLSLIAGGSLGADRLAEVGPSAWQVGLITALEVGVAAAITAWVANWAYLRRMRTDAAADGDAATESADPVETGEGLEADAATADASASGREDGAGSGREDGAGSGREPVLTLVKADPDTYVAAEDVDAPVLPAEDRGDVDDAPEPNRRASGRSAWRSRLPRFGWRRRGAPDVGDDAEELYGITYEADPESTAPEGGDGGDSGDAAPREPGR